MTRQEFIDQKVSETLPAEVQSWNMVDTARRIEWGQALVEQYGGDLSVYQLLAKNMYDFAEAIADEREERYGPFDRPVDGKKNTDIDPYDAASECEIMYGKDPYKVDWSKAPEWANWHAVDQQRYGGWYADKPIRCVDGFKPTSHFLCETDYFSFSPAWELSLRKRP